MVPMFHLITDCAFRLMQNIIEAIIIRIFVNKLFFTNSHLINVQYHEFINIWDINIQLR